ncbi:MAG: hypothetical protein WDN01_03770 [Rhizomicrobium sp.]
MVKIIERSDKRLKVHCGERSASASVCTIDRDLDIAEISWLTLRIPFRRKRVALSNVLDIAVRRRAHRKVYQPVVELRVGGTISLGGYTKEEAMEAARAIRDFLHQTRGTLVKTPP